MPPVFIAGGRQFHEGPTHGFLGWPGGQTVFGRIRGSAYSHWDGLSGVGMRCLPASPGYNSCFCPADSLLLMIKSGGIQPTYVYGTTAAMQCCTPCLVSAGTCLCRCPGMCDDCHGGPLDPPPLCVMCDALCGGASPNAGGLPGNIKAMPLSGILGFYEMEALGFTVHDWDTLDFLDGGWAGATIGPFVGPDGIVFPGNAPGPDSSRISNVLGGFWWMGAYRNSGDNSVLYVMAMGGCYPIIGTVPGWDSQMVTDGIGGLIQVFTLGPVITPTLPKIAFGHAANCNAYPPIPWGSGSFSAPGNGLLVGDPLQGVIPGEGSGAGAVGVPYSPGSIAPGLAGLWSWARANGISASMCIDAQRSAKDIMDELLAIGNSAGVYSGDILKIIGYDEISMAGNGAVYVAPTSTGPVANLTDKDYATQDDPRVAPVKFTRKARTDCDNVFAIEFVDRTLDYAHNVTSFPVQKSVALYGPRKGGTLSAEDLGRDIPSGAKAYLSLTSAAAAQAIASILAKRSAAGVNEYEFELKQEWLPLEAMDLVTLTDSRLGLNQKAVRLTSVKETSKRTLLCTADEFIYGLNHPSLKETTATTGSSSPSSIDPGMVNVPIIFQPPVEMLPPGSPPQIWILVSGADPQFGGSLGFLSVDGGVSYPIALGSIAPATTGDLTADYPNNTDPDTSDTLSVNLTESNGALASQSQQIADGFLDPVYLGGNYSGMAYTAFEVVCPTVATLTSAFNYDLTTYIRRAVQGTTAMDHPIGSRFGVISGAVLKIDLNPQWIGTTLYFKFIAFNLTGGQSNDLSNVVAYPYTPFATLLPGDFYIN